MENKKTIVIVIFAFLFWVVIASTIQRFYCASLTETELFLNIPNSVICNFKKC